MSPAPATPCACWPDGFPFHCRRHGCRKTEHWHFLCRTRWDYFQLWEERRGPGQRRVVPQPSPQVQQQVTCGITAFKRPQCLEKLVASIRRFYPEIRILVADNGDRPADLSSYENLEYLQLAFDCGLSAARNRLIERLQTPYMLLLEEDFVFTVETRIETLLEVLEWDHEVGLAGGALIQDGRRVEFTRDLEIFRGELIGSPSRGPFHATPQGTEYQLAEMVFNFGLFRREMLAEHRWDESLKLREHPDYFLQVKQAGRWRVAFCPMVSCHHSRHRPAEYRKYRARQGGTFSQRLKDKWSLSAIRVAPITPVARTAERPNLILFGIGHSGTSVVTAMLGRLGWNLGPADEEFAEHVPVRELNTRLLQRGRFDRKRAARILDELAEPWALKDPRFVHTLDRWKPVLEPFTPTLLWLVRDVEAVKDSFRRRQGLDGREPVSRGCTIEELYRMAERTYQDWPWGKLRIAYDEIAEAVQLFDPQAGGEAHEPSTASNRGSNC